MLSQWSLNLRCKSCHTAAPDIESGAALVRRMAAGDQRALGILYDRHGAPAYALARAITAQPARAETAIADAFASAWRGASTFDPERASLHAWLLSIIRTRALAARGEGASVPRTFTEDCATRGASANGETDASMRGVSALDPMQARAVGLAYFGGLSKVEIAHALRLTEEAVTQLLRAPVESLRRSFAPNEFDSPRASVADHTESAPHRDRPSAVAR